MSESFESFEAKSNDAACWLVVRKFRSDDLRMVENQQLPEEEEKAGGTHDESPSEEVRSATLTWYCGENFTSAPIPPAHPKKERTLLQHRKPFVNPPHRLLPQLLLLTQRPREVHLARKEDGLGEREVPLQPRRMVIKRQARHERSSELWIRLQVRQMLARPFEIVRDLRYEGSEFRRERLRGWRGCGGMRWGRGGGGGRSG